MEFDNRLNLLIDAWKKQTEKQIECQNDGDDHTICPSCNSQLYWCDCAPLAAQKILELQFGFDDFEN